MPTFSCTTQQQNDFKSNPPIFTNELRLIKTEIVPRGKRFRFPVRKVIDLEILIKPLRVFQKVKVSLEGFIDSPRQFTYVTEKI